MHALCSAHVSEGSSPPSTLEYSRARARTWALTECKAASLDLSLEQPMQRGDRVKRCGWPCAQSFLESHTCAPPYGSWPTPLHPSVCLLAWCGFAAPLSTSTAERTDFQGFGTSSTRRAGPPAQARWLAGERTTHNAHRARDGDAIATRPEADLLPRSGLCSPSPMAQAGPSMACTAVVLTSQPGRP